MKRRLVSTIAKVGNLLTGRDAIVESQRAMITMQRETLDVQRATLQLQGVSADYLRRTFNTVVLLSRDVSNTGDPRRSDPRRLLPYGYKGYSQGDEDGIIDEIFRRIGTTNRFFVEFGVGSGLENNTVALLLAGWRGAWLEGGEADVDRIQRTFQADLAADTLRLRRTFITAENIEALFAELGVPEEPDLLSIDIDGNDYWVWRAITRYRPRVVIVEYNASFGRSAHCVVPYRPDWVWAHDSHYGASLAAIEALGRDKGYALVGCSFLGTNAFFVRDDVLGDHFHAPYTAANHFEPARFWLAPLEAGHPAAWGDREQV